MIKDYFLLIPRWLIIAGLLAIVVMVGFKFCTYYHHIRFVPKEMGVSKVLYAEEVALGFGPGGNETGVIAFELPQSTVKVIDKSGFEYFSHLPIVENETYQHRIYEAWHSTPIPQQDEIWFTIPASDRFLERLTTTPQLNNFLDRYGHGIGISKIIENQINNAISTPGSYFAYGRTGVIIVAPLIERVFFVYSG